MPDDLVLEILKGIQEKVAELPAMQSELLAMRRDIAILVQEGRMVRSALADIGLTRVSAGEIETIHADINAILERLSRVEVAAGLVK